MDLGLEVDHQLVFRLSVVTFVLGDPFLQVGALSRPNVAVGEVHTLRTESLGLVEPNLPPFKASLEEEWPVVVSDGAVSVEQEGSQSVGIVSLQESEGLLEFVTTVVHHIDLALADNVLHVSFHGLLQSLVELSLERDVLGPSVRLGLQVLPSHHTGGVGGSGLRTGEDVAARGSSHARGDPRLRH